MTSFLYDIYPNIFSILVRPFPDDFRGGGDSGIFENAPKVMNYALRALILEEQKILSFQGLFKLFVFCKGIK